MKNSVKSTISLKKLKWLVNWGIFYIFSKNSVKWTLPKNKCVCELISRLLGVILWHNIEKYCKMRSRLEFFRLINSLVTSFVKTLIWRKNVDFSEKIVIAFYTSCIAFSHCVVFVKAQWFHGISTKYWFHEKNIHFYFILTLGRGRAQGGSHHHSSNCSSRE